MFHLQIEMSFINSFGVFCNHIVGQDVWDMISYRLCPLLLRLKQSICCRETILLEVSPVDKWRRVEKVFLIANTNSAFSETVCLFVRFWRKHMAKPAAFVQWRFFVLLIWSTISSWELSRIEFAQLASERSRNNAQITLWVSLNCFLNHLKLAL